MKDVLSSNFIDAEARLCKRRSTKLRRLVRLLSLMSTPSVPYARIVFGISQERIRYSRYSTRSSVISLTCDRNEENILPPVSLSVLLCTTALSLPKMSNLNKQFVVK